MRYWSINLVSCSGYDLIEVSSHYLNCTKFGLVLGPFNHVVLLICRCQTFPFQRVSKNVDNHTSRGSKHSPDPDLLAFTAQCWNMCRTDYETRFKRGECPFTSKSVSKELSTHFQVDQFIYYKITCILSHVIEKTVRTRLIANSYVIKIFVLSTSD